MSEYSVNDQVRSPINKRTLIISGAVFLGYALFHLAFSGSKFDVFTGIASGFSFLILSYIPRNTRLSLFLTYFVLSAITILIFSLVFGKEPDQNAAVWFFPYILLIFFFFSPFVSLVILSIILLCFIAVFFFESAGVIEGLARYPGRSVLRISLAYIVCCTVLYFLSFIYRRTEERISQKNKELQESFLGLKHLSEELEVSRKNYMEIITRAKDGIVLVQDGKIVFTNSAFLNMLDYNSSEVLGKTYEDFFVIGLREMISGKSSLNTDQEGTLEYLMKTKAGDEITVEITSADITYYDKPALLVFVRDIRARKNSENKLKYMAYYDELTGLLNRKSFYEKVERALELGKRRGFIDTWALLYIDLDNFKDVNDSLGHGAGDQVLLEVSNRLRNSVRESDDIFRIAGDEFAVILGTITTVTDAGYVARKILHALASPFLLLDREISVTASIGVSVYPKDGTEPDSLIKNADMAMYEAKKHRNRYHFFDSLLDRELEKRIEISRDLRKALENDEFCLFFQPIVDETKTVVNAEALIRWNHPKKGLLSPGYFLAIAEETGFIREIEKWVIHAVCSQIRDWIEDGIEVVPVSLNITPHLLSDPNFMTYFMMYTERFSIPAHYLKVEITESSSMTNPDEVRKKMDLLTEEGFKIMIDDFGTGYSSLAYLNRFPAQEIKIDKAFIHPIPEDKDASLLVKSIVTLAHSLGFSVVAEGVETQEQNAYLQEISCDLQQGYFYSPPIPADEFILYLQDSDRTRRGIINK